MSKEDSDIDTDIQCLFRVQSQPDIDHRLQYVLDNTINGVTDEQIQERRRDLAAGNPLPLHLYWLSEPLAGVRE